ncbi:carboxypeptidase regulatory-like domain-containing protein [Granulicella sp. 5B5]|nr:carboxypeptidase regulatory-like domain-containing protein [Granulicella sp. 5B5]
MKAGVLGAVLCAAVVYAQDAPAVGQSPAPAQVTAVAQGGTVRGTVVAGAAGKAGGVPLPGVSVTATNTLTGKKYTTATDIDGAYAMTIPKNGRYVIKAELTGFATATQEVVLNGGETAEKTMPFGLELASRAAAQEAAAAATTNTTTSGGRGTVSLSLGESGLDAADASAGTGNTGTSLPSLGGLGDSADAGNESIAVSGNATAQENGLAGISEDEIRSRVEDAVAHARENGMLPQGGDPTNAIVGALGGMMGGGGPGGGRGGFGGGGGRGGRGGGGGGGFGAFRNFNPAQPHGSIFYQGGNNALNSAPWSPSLLPLTNPAAYSNRYGVTLAGSPYVPGLTKPNTKQFVFINLTGQKNLNAFLPNPVRVPTTLEREGDFSQSTQVQGSSTLPVVLYDPKTGQPIPGNNLANASEPISPIAQALLNYYPAPNIATNVQGYNYQTISNAGSNNVAINSRYIRTLGQGTSTPFGRFGGGGGRGQNRNAKPSLRQNINVMYNYSHSANDQRNIFLPLGGATENDGNALNLGYTIGYGRLSNNASVNWNRLHAETRNYFTDTSNNPSANVGLNIPNQAGDFADPRFYNGLASLNITNFAGLSNTTPSETTNQTISFTDFVAWRHKKHNMRFGFDIRRVHNDQIGGSNPLGTFTFTGYATSSPEAQAAGTAGTTTGSGFADFLLGLPATTAIQAGLHKIYLRENVYDWYAQDDFRVASNLTLNFGIRYEYFAPYTEKNNRLVNLDHNANFTQVDTVMPGQNGTYEGHFNDSLVNPDRTMYAPRFGVAWRPKTQTKLTKDVVVRGGYGINYNTGAFASFAQSLSHQVPFAVTQTNTLTSGCTTLTPTTAANMTLANGFGCSSNYAIANNYAVDKNYRLGMVQIYNLNIQKTLPLQTVFNLGYNGTHATGLDIYGTPNGTALGSAIAGVAPFEFETSGATLRSNQLVVSLQKRQQKGIALGATYTYGHAIDDASAVGNGAAHTPMQNFFNLQGEEGNSSMDVRHTLTGNWVAELPFGPNRAFLNKGGVMGKVLDGFDLSGNFTFASGNYFTPQYSGNQAEAGSGLTYSQRPNRNYGVSTKGPGRVGEFFNTSAFTAPTVANGATLPGTANVGSIEGPGQVSVSASLSRTVQFAGTNSFEARVTATNVLNTVQYSGIDTSENSETFGRVTSAAAMRTLLVQARYRF